MILPEFISTDAEAIISEMVAYYEELTGRTLQPGQAERLLINAFAYREALIRQQIQYACSQMLVNFANAPALDELGVLVGVERLAAAGAAVTIRFTLLAGHNGIVIPSGTRVASSDGKVNFATQSNVSVASGVNSVDVECFSEETGTLANGYGIGAITKILDPQPFIVSASNTTVSAGGADIETDEELRDRIKLAPSQYSVAGPADAYKFFAKSASSSIIDVAVTNPTPGTVNVYPLVKDTFPTPSEILSLVASVVNDQKVRPLTDTVVVLSPSAVYYDIEIEITIYEGESPEAIQEAAESALEAFQERRRTTLGLDALINQIEHTAFVDGVYQVAVVSPAVNQIISEIQVAVCNSVTVSITGTNNG